MDANAFGGQEALAQPGRIYASEDVYTIGDLARDFGVTLRALRFYEDKGLLSPRREGLARLYSATDRERLELILKGKRLGFTLSEIRGLVAAREGTAGTRGLALTRERCLSQLTQLERQRAEIDAAIAELRDAATRLTAA
ncbi:MerR family transcriptional regulator [Aquabacter spiritensis]|uniref:MerR family transcriptional regulator n=1 Tax=Aquabacter spiritensis TaxID=933073 RepID=A0A4R3M334_9HYPH|nr:MerR family DNA-binding transcriptional regulator [Aquabacter spiritensis]TCT05565.1 MerR family transcriptional regulator [Aquabacter spiritensis]